MSIKQLEQLVPPPLTPFECGSLEDWATIEQELGSALPDDYKALIHTYGTGSFNDFLFVYNPFAANRYLNLFKQREQKLAVYREIQREFPEDAPYPVFPEPGGLLPWAGTDNGNVLYWRTEGEPNTWTIVIYDGDHVEHERYALSTTTFLTQILSGSLRSYMLPESFVSDHPEPEFIARA